MVVAGTKDAVLMVESEAMELPEDIMLGGVLYAHQEMQTVIQACAELAKDAGKPRWEWQAPAENTQLTAQLAEQFASSVETAYSVTDKSKRHERLSELRNQAVEQLVDEAAGIDSDDVNAAFATLEENLVQIGRASGREGRW